MRIESGCFTMTRKQYLAAIRRLGLSQVGAGRALGVSERQAQRYAAGDSPIPPPIARLLTLMLAAGPPSKQGVVKR
jgi:hypothetical protein